MDNTTFMDAEDHIIETSPMKDEHQLIKITEKTPVLQNIGKIVCGDTNSNILTFEINRYYDNADLYTKNIKFIVKNELGTFVENAVNLQYNDELLRFSWILSESVTYKSGTVTAAIIFIGMEPNEKYALKTLPFTIKIENSLDFLDIDPPYKNWFIDIENMIYSLENSSGSSDSSIDHNHENKPVLDKLSVSEDGELLYDGKKIQSSTDTPQSAYDIAVDHGFSGTEEEWLESLKGDPGTDGEAPTAEEVATVLKSDTDFMESLNSNGDSSTANLTIINKSEDVLSNTSEGKLVDALVVKEVFQSVSNGKELLASAITDKGVETDATDTFDVMAENISNISSGGNGNESGDIKSPLICHYSSNLSLSTGSSTFCYYFPIKKMKKLILKSLNFYGRKGLTSATNKSIQFIISGTKEDGSIATINSFSMTMSSTTNSSIIKEDTEIDISDFTSIEYFSIRTYNTSGTIYDYIINLECIFELYF